VSLSIEHGFIRHVQTSLQVGAIFHIRNTTCRFDYNILETGYVLMFKSEMFII